MSMLEAECTRCGEIFVPLGTDSEDLVHTYCESRDEDCGGILATAQSVGKLF